MLTPGERVAVAPSSELGFPFQAPAVEPTIRGAIPPTKSPTTYFQHNQDLRLKTAEALAVRAVISAKRLLRGGWSFGLDVDAGSLERRHFDWLVVGAWGSNKIISDTNPMGR
jgi:hypothetical protein